VAREWIEQGLRQMLEREEQQRLAANRRLEQAAVIREKGPELMRQLVAEVGAVAAEYREKAPPGEEIEFEALPHEGFRIARSPLPKVALECRPGYETHVVYCNMTRIDGHESEVKENVFSLDMTVDEANRIALRHERAAFPSVGDAVEFLVKPVLFPPLDSDRGTNRGGLPPRPAARNQ
jgi:hypothetical protein